MSLHPSHSEAQQGFTDGSGAAILFGADEQHHWCGQEFKIVVVATLSGGAGTFSPDGFAFDELDDENTEADVWCEGCREHWGFGEWQDAAYAKVEAMEEAEGCDDAKLV